MTLTKGRVVTRPSAWQWVSLVAFVAIVVAANLATQAWGVVSVLGVTATAGTWLAGFGFVARDALHETGGRRWVISAIALGAVVSAGIAPALALASAAAFTVSELADWAIYTPLRDRSIVAAALASNTVGAVLDSAVFLALAEFPLSGVWTQTLVKVATTTALVIGVRLALLRQSDRLTIGGGRHA